LLGAAASILILPYLFRGLPLHPLSFCILLAPLFFLLTFASGFVWRGWEQTLSCRYNIRTVSEQENVEFVKPADPCVLEPRVTIRIIHLPFPPDPNLKEEGKEAVVSGECGGLEDY
jgi:hypothetical protein